MDSKIGNSWLQLQLRGEQNAKSKGNFKRTGHTFVVEREDDGQSLLSFMKMVVPEYQELIPPSPPCQSIARFNQSRHNSIVSTESGPAPRQLRQNTETTIALNAFSDLEAIAKMGAGTEDTESQISEQSTRPSSMLADHCSPGIGPYQPQSIHPFAGNYDQRQMSEQHNLCFGGNEQQRMNTNVVYRKQQQQTKPMIPVVGALTMRPMDTQAAFQSNTDVFNFVPEQHPSPFGDPSPSFVSATSPYQSPTGGARRRGRGRKACNMGDRQPSSSSIEHDSTPDSPSEFGMSKKQRKTGGQQRPRKPKKTANIGFDQESLSHNPYQTADTPPLIKSSLTAVSSNYISSQTEEEIRSKLRTAYEMDFCESSSDDQEMDPPPPPKNLITQQNWSKQKGNSESNSAAEEKKIDTGEMETAGTEAKVEPELAQGKTSDGNSAETHPQIEPVILRDIKLVSASPSSLSSSPSVSQLSEQSAGGVGDTKPIKIGPELEFPQQKKQQQTETESTGDRTRETEVGNPKKKTDSITRPNKQPKKKGSGTGAEPKRDSNELVRKNSTDTIGSSKRPAIVLKIRNPKETKVATTGAAKHSSSSSSPSSSSSSSAISTIAMTTADHQQQAPMARLSGSAAPPSKYKQQQQQKAVKRPQPAEEVGKGTKKKCRKTGEGTRTETGEQQRQSGGGAKLAKEGAKTGTAQTQKEKLPAAALISQISAPFPSLKNFKIPKVVENNSESAPMSSQSSQNKGQIEQQQQQGAHQHPPADKSIWNNSYDKSNDSFDRRPNVFKPNRGPGPGQYHQQMDKYPAGPSSSSYQAQIPYNRQQPRPPKQQKGGGRHGNLEAPGRKYSNNSGSGGAMLGERNPRIPGPPPHRFVGFPTLSREMPPGPFAHQPPSSGWVQQQPPPIGPYNVPNYQSPWMGPEKQRQAAEQRQQTNTPRQHRPSTGQQQQQQMIGRTEAPGGGGTNPREGGGEERNNEQSPPSAGTGLQIVDED